MKHFIQLVLGSKPYHPTKVSTEDCKDVDDFKRAIKREFSHLLHEYDVAQLTHFEADGNTEIDPQKPVAELKEANWKPMIIKVEQPATQVTTSSSKKQLTYKGMSVEASCRKYLDALVRKIAVNYDFNTEYSTPTMGELGLRIKVGQESLGCSIA